MNTDGGSLSSCHSGMRGTMLITEAVRNRTSDIHIEPMEDRVLLRYRIDGVCHIRDNLPKRMQAAILARLKLMAGVNIAERRIPQDGRIKMSVDGDQIDFRVSTCPAYHGESVVLRILRPDSVRIGLVNLGFEQENLDSFNKLIRRPNGILLVTGPTGSGKTRTSMEVISSYLKNAKEGAIVIWLAHSQAPHPLPAANFGEDALLLLLGAAMDQIVYEKLVMC